MALSGHPDASRKLLNRESCEVGRKHEATLMRREGRRSPLPTARTNGGDREHPVFPYLLRGMTIDRANQVWAMDTTYIPIRRGLAYLAAVVDWATPGCWLGWVSISLAADPAVEALEEAIARYGVRSHEH